MLKLFICNMFLHFKIVILDILCNITKRYNIVQYSWKTTTPNFVFLALYYGPHKFNLTKYQLKTTSFCFLERNVVVFVILRITHNCNVTQYIIAVRSYHHLMFLNLTHLMVCISISDIPQMIKNYGLPCLNQL